jgi:prephenate dehydrogenase
MVATPPLGRVPSLYLHFPPTPTRPFALRPTRLGILGLGAIGGSLARQAKRAGVATVVGWSPEPAERVAAVQQGALDDAPHHAREVVAAAELLVLAAPPAANLELLGRIASHLAAGAIVTDVGSVKRAIVARAEALGLGARFAGSHPLAGTHRRGFEASRADLFSGATVYVTPTATGDGAAREVAHFWETVCGAHPVTMDAAAHDAQLAVTSHVPQIVGSLLGNILARHTPVGAGVGPGALDTARLAASDAHLWTEILLLNRDQVLPALRAFEEPLGEVERALESGDASALERWLASAAEWRRQAGP